MGAQALQCSSLAPFLCSVLLAAMLPPMKAMKAMKAAATKKAGPKAMTATQACSSVASSTGLKSKEVKAVVTSYMSVAAEQLKKNGSFKFVGALNLKLKKKAATPARKGINPFTKEPCVFKAKPASNKVRALALKKFKDLVN